MRHFYLFIFILVPVVALNACSMKKLAVSSTADIIGDGMASFNDEEDVMLARTASASNLKLIEALILADPENEKLLLTAAEGFGGVAFGFFEMDMERYRDEDDDKFELSKKRALIFYRRGMKYAMKTITDDFPEFERLTKEGSVDEMNELVAKMDEEFIPGLFWTGLCWGSIINNNRDDMTVVAALPKVKVIMSRVMEMNPGFFNAGPHLFFGVFNAGMPKMLGGNPEKGKEHFEKASELTDNKLLLVNVFYARFYAVAVQDKELFIKQLDKVLEAPNDIYPGQTLYTMLAKERAKILKTKIDDFFM